MPEPGRMQFLSLCSIFTAGFDMKNTRWTGSTLPLIHTRSHSRGRFFAWRVWPRAFWSEHVSARKCSGINRGYFTTVPSDLSFIFAWVVPKTLRLVQLHSGLDMSKDSHIVPNELGSQIFQVHIVQVLPESCDICSSHGMVAWTVQARDDGSPSVAC